MGTHVGAGLRPARAVAVQPQNSLDDGIRDQQRWSLGRRVLQEMGLMDWDSPLFKTKGSLQLDLAWAGRPFLSWPP